LIPWFVSVKPKYADLSKKVAAIRREGQRVSFIANFSLGHLLDLAVGVVVAFVLATLIGAERQWRQRSAGLRTNVLVAVGAAAFVSLGMHLNGNAGAAQIASYVVSGIGFLGAGVIMKEGAHVWGLNTAATLWCSAAVGALSGVGLPAEAAVLTLAVLAGNTMLRPLVNVINRAPMDEHLSEATYEVHVVTTPDTVGEVRDLLADALEKASYPIRQLEVEERSPKASELKATLVSTSVDPAELDAVATELEKSPLVSFATWSAESGEHG
jgi:putative Mg2+ transporter-C (MgtC) family protein